MVYASDKTTYTHIHVQAAPGCSKGGRCVAVAAADDLSAHQETPLPPLRGALREPQGPRGGISLHDCIDNCLLVAHLYVYVCVYMCICVCLVGIVQTGVVSVS